MLEFAGVQEGSKQGLVGSLNSVRKRDANPQVTCPCHSVRYRQSEAYLQLLEHSYCFEVPKVLVHTHP